MRENSIARCGTDGEDDVVSTLNNKHWATGCHYCHTVSVSLSVTDRALDWFGLVAIKSGPNSDLSLFDTFVHSYLKSCIKLMCVVFDRMTIVFYCRPN